MSQQEWQGFKWAEMVLRQEKIPTLDKPLIITVCPVGALFSRKQNPDQPYSPQEIAEQAVAACNEGAAMVHLHNRDERGYHKSTVELMKETVDKIVTKCPDVIIQPSSCEGYAEDTTQYTYGTVKPMVDALHAISKKHMESTIFTPVSYCLEHVDEATEPEVTLAQEKNSVLTIQYLQEHGIKPEFMNHNWEGIQNVVEWLIKPGILQKPYLMSMGPGMHNTAPVHLDPWGHLYVLGMMKMMPEGSVIGISAGGRNWLSLSVFAMLMGVDIVRVGMEDHLWMYPHKDEKIRNNADEVRKIATIARELGRPIATPAEARKIMGIQ
ncbi:MAG: kce [Candidatus Aminicenantes bacterium]|jgi:3-keto-5-aminohexanoate cleavage enzyme|nr:kce [Candidatus Aminicenantes bacterium]